MNKEKIITRAVLPVAGLGTRLYPVTKVIAKEMLPLCRKPLLQVVIEELVCCGITNILLITRAGKSMIEEYFGDGSPWGITINYLYIDSYGLRGPGHAILLSKSWVDSQPFLIVFCDCIFFKHTEEEHIQILHEPLKRLLAIYSANPFDIATILTPPEYRPKGQYMSVGVSSISKEDYICFESSQVDIAANGIGKLPCLTAAARWIVTPDIFPFLERICFYATHEVYMPEAVMLLLKEGHKEGLGVVLDSEEKLIDLGSWNAYEKIIELTLKKEATCQPLIADRSERK